MTVVPLVWLPVGFLYGAMCLDAADTRQALATLAARLRTPGQLIARQLAFLGGFALSIGIVHALAALWWLVAASIGGGLLAPLTLALAAPALVYALGYTTANLKSLQLWLYARP
jgi:hypothetical protein